MGIARFVTCSKEPQRWPKLFVPRGVQISFLVSLIALLLYNLYCLTRLRIDIVRVPITGLAAELDGLRIAHLSDFHLGRLGTSRRVLARAVEETARFQPDLVALTGDYIDGPHADNTGSLLDLLDFCAPAVAVLGNHDYYRGPVHLAQTLRALDYSGVNVLINQATCLSACGTCFWVVGLDDPFTSRSDVRLAVDWLPNGERPLIMLAHAPVLSALGELDQVGLVLCGHTHGGQIRIFPSGDVPGKRLLRWIAGEANTRRDPDLHRGVHRRGNATIVISEGLGVSLLPVRLRTRPHLVLLHLVRR